MSRRRVAAFALVALLAVLLEATVFNWPHWASRGWEPVAAPVAVEHDVERRGDTYMVTGGDPTLTLAYAGDLNALDVGFHGAADAGGRPVHGVDVVVGLTDDAHPVHAIDLGVRTVTDRDSTITLFPYGRVGQLRMRIRLPVGTVFRLGTPVANPRIPFTVNRVRALIWLAALAWIGLGGVLRRAWSDTRLAWALMPVFLLAGLALVVGVNRLPLLEDPDAWTSWEASFEYQRMARSLAQGHAWLDIPVPGWLRDMDDPLVTQLRDLAQARAGDTKLPLDYAFDGEHWQMYFGILPCVLLYLPYHMWTGGDLSNSMAGLVESVPLVFAAMFAAHMLRRRFRPDAPVMASNWLGLGLTVMVQPGLYLTFTSGIYVVPILMAVTLILTGWGVWCLAATRPAGAGRLVLVVVGALLVGLVAGCRPQMTLAGLAAPVLLCQGWGGSGRPAWRDAIRDATACLLPAGMAMAPFLWWNRIRFGSPWDFGGMRQVTGPVMNMVTDPVGRAAHSLVVLTVLPPSAIPRFPWLDATDVGQRAAGNIQAYMFSEPVLGGALWYAPVAVFALFAFTRRRMSMPSRVFAVGAWLASGMLIAMDVILAANTSRYMSDFAVLLCCAGAAVLFDSFDDRWLRRLLPGLTVLAVLLGLLSLFMPSRYGGPYAGNPYVYTQLRDLLMIM